MRGTFGDTRFFSIDDVARQGPLRIHRRLFVRKGTPDLLNRPVRRRATEPVHQDLPNHRLLDQRTPTRFGRDDPSQVLHISLMQVCRRRCTLKRLRLMRSLGDRRCRAGLLHPGRGRRVAIAEMPVLLAALRLPTHCTLSNVR